MASQSGMTRGLAQRDWMNLSQCHFLFHLEAKQIHFAQLKKPLTFSALQHHGGLDDLATCMMDNVKKRCSQQSNHVPVIILLMK